MDALLPQNTPVTAFGCALAVAGLIGIVLNDSDVPGIVIIIPFACYVIPSLLVSLVRGRYPLLAKPQKRPIVAAICVLVGFLLALLMIPDKLPENELPWVALIASGVTIPVTYAVAIVFLREILRVSM